MTNRDKAIAVLREGLLMAFPAISRPQIDHAAEQIAIALNDAFNDGYAKGLTEGREEIVKLIELKEGSARSAGESPVG